MWWLTKTSSFGWWKHLGPAPLWLSKFMLPLHCDDQMPKQQVQWLELYLKLFHVSIKPRSISFPITNLCENFCSFSQCFSGRMKKSNHSSILVVLLWYLLQYLGLHNILQQPITQRSFITLRSLDRTEAPAKSNYSTLVCNRLFHILLT